jgi:hypothetical protein
MPIISMSASRSRDASEARAPGRCGNRITKSVTFFQCMTAS